MQYLAGKRIALGVLSKVFATLTGMTIGLLPAAGSFEVSTSDLFEQSRCVPVSLSLSLWFGGFKLGLPTNRHVSVSSLDSCDILNMLGYDGCILLRAFKFKNKR